MKSIIVGTAGHIDHGKSALVQALTGKDPDRLPEEKRRGITIDLGFADLELEGVRFGFVDVPGHERFVRNMLAGAHGIDLVALVIAADEGVMPQTREHFDICRLLKIPAGLIVITKIDLVEPDLMPLVVGEAEELVAGSFLEGAPIVSVSSKTLAGIEELKSVLRTLALDVPDRSSELVALLPIDRAFTMKGFGPVVTGTLISGEIDEGEELELLPNALKVRARGLQVHGVSVKTAVAGQRTAVNLGNVGTSLIERGMVLAPVGRFEPGQILDVSMEVLPSAPRALRSRSRIRFHLHTSEVLGRLRILDDPGEIPAGGKGFAQIRLESPVVAHAGERFIIRSYSPSITVAGGTILNPFAVKHRGKDFAAVRGALVGLKEGTPARKFSIFVSEARDRGRTLNELAARTGWSDAALNEAARVSLEEKAVVNCDGVFVSRDDFDRLSRLVMDEVKTHHKREPLARGLARETLRERSFAHSPAEVFRSVLAGLEKSGLLIAEKEIVRAVEHSVELSETDAQSMNRLEAVFKQAGLETPSLEAAFLAAGFRKTDASLGRKILHLLIDRGSVVRIQPEMILHCEAIDRLVTKLRAYADKNEPNRSLDVTAFKDLAGVSRKYAIPLLEYLDRERITRREGDHRVVLKA
jgi:selenocysteine-specific elongation factor